ncbi:putative TM Protein [Veiled chameleon serpentovirus A]|uniref:TM Protein n=1 Tax=Veiled chameleon serpentovirus A TaxID=2806429 RepID=A0AAE7TST9_9NIDO|nr:putative TM Protein [Veiled chameleon serpentovirus A]QRC47051.1 putative TM Protein [Veiled chameleon serpentovirus A]
MKNTVTTSLALTLSFLLSVSKIDVVVSQWNGTSIGPYPRGEMQIPGLTWNDRFFACMSCKNESGTIYYYDIGRYMCEQRSGAYLGDRWGAKRTVKKMVSLTFLEYHIDLQESQLIKYPIDPSMLVVSDHLQPYRHYNYTWPLVHQQTVKYSSFPYILLGEPKNNVKYINDTTITLWVDPTIKLYECGKTAFAYIPVGTLDQKKCPTPKPQVQKTCPACPTQKPCPQCKKKGKCPACPSCQTCPTQKPCPACPTLTAKKEDEEGSGVMLPSKIPELVQHSYKTFKCECENGCKLDVESGILVFNEYIGSPLSVSDSNFKFYESAVYIGPNADGLELECRDAPMLVGELNDPSPYQTKDSCVYLAPGYWFRNPNTSGIRTKERPMLCNITTDPSLDHDRFIRRNYTGLTDEILADLPMDNNTKLIIAVVVVIALLLVASLIVYACQKNDNQEVTLFKRKNNKQLKPLLY